MKTIGLLSISDLENYEATKKSVESWKKENGNDVLILNTQHTKEIEKIGKELNVPVYKPETKFGYPLHAIDELNILCDWIVEELFKAITNLKSEYVVIGEPDCLFFKKTNLDDEDDSVDVFPPSSVENDKSLFWAFVGYYRSYGHTDEEKNVRIKKLFNDLRIICQKYGLDWDKASDSDLRFIITGGAIIKKSRIEDLYNNCRDDVRGLIIDVCHAIYKNKPTPEVNQAITSLFPVDIILSIVLGLYLFKWSVKKNYYNHSSHNFVNKESIEDFIKTYKDTECIHGVKLYYLNQGKAYGYEYEFNKKLKKLNATNSQITSNIVSYDKDPKKLVDYCVNPELMHKCIFMQVYEEFLNFSYWVKGFSPNNILEIGTMGSTFWIMSKLSSGKKISVDIDPRESIIHHFMWGEDWKFFHGSSQDPKIYEKVKNECDKFDLIFIDGDHTYDGVKQDFNLYKNLLSDRGYIVFHDIDPSHIFADSYAGQVYKFWKELNEGTKTNILCTRSSGRIKLNGVHPQGFGGIGLWRPY